MIKRLNKISKFKFKFKTFRIEFKHHVVLTIDDYKNSEKSSNRKISWWDSILSIIASVLSIIRSVFL